MHEQVNKNRQVARMVASAAITALLSLPAWRNAAAGQLNQPISEAQVRAFTRQARQQSQGDPTTLVLKLDARIRDAWGEFESFPISIIRREELLVTLTTPYMGYRRSLIDLLRQKRSIDRIAWVDTAVVSVAPARLGSPDIESVVLTREHREVPAIRTTLRPMTFSNGSGGQGILHAGDVHFSASAFAPGAAVTLTLRPAQGAPYEYVFSEAELVTLK